MELTGKVALVTGASRGIGQAILFALAQQGATVIGTATTQAGADKITAALKEKNYPGLGLPWRRNRLSSGTGSTCPGCYRLWFR